MSKQRYLFYVLCPLCLATSVAQAVDQEYVAKLEARLDALQQRLAVMEQKENETWLTDERATQIRGLVQEVIADAKTRGQFADGDLQAGYNNGFFIQSADKNFKLSIGGYVQFRYSYANAEVHNKAAFGSSAPKGGDASGFDFRRARLYFSGNAFSPNLQFMLSGDFASNSTNAADFQIVDAYLAYKFSDMVGVRAGSYVVPFSHAEYVTPGLQFTETPFVLSPFDPIRSVGVGVYGSPIKDKFTYEFMANNGSQENTAGRATELSGKIDNRMGFYGRLQWAGAGKVSEFNDEPDLRKDNSNFIWMLGVAGGYESQNSISSAFPSAQSTANLIGLSNGEGPGFRPSAALNGDLYRGTADWHAKWQGFSLTTAGYYQQINDNPPAGSSSDNFTSTFGNSSLFQAGYYIQVGYMLIPNRLELVGRFGQLMTEGFPNTCEEYSLGMNYYLFGHNAKIQTDLTYIPNEAAYSSSVAGSFINTQDLIYRIQLQLKF